VETYVVFYLLFPLGLLVKNSRFDKRVKFRMSRNDLIVRFARDVIERSENAKAKLGIPPEFPAKSANQRYAYLGTPRSKRASARPWHSLRHNASSAVTEKPEILMIFGQYFKNVIYVRYGSCIF
jgi:hypothetical protein